jgi:hypothetical protein
VNRSNPCRCHKKTRGFIEHGHVDPARVLFVPEHLERVRDVAGETVREIEDLVERQHVALYREHPFLQPADEIRWLRTILERPDVRGALRLRIPATRCHGPRPTVSMRQMERNAPSFSPGGRS